MAAGFLRNAVKRQYSGDHLWRIHSIADSIKAPVIRNQFPRQQQQPSKAFSRFPNSIYRKAKELDFSVPSSILSSPFSSTASSVTKIGVVGWYLGMIKSRPILTKSITSALIYTVADFSSQVPKPLSQNVLYMFLFVGIYAFCLESIILS